MDGGGARRRRRKPEEARQLILEAAREVLGELGPDRAGLKDVARAAGVSHGLVTHYFGTFDNLVEATLKVHAVELRTELLEAIASRPSDTSVIVDVLLERVADPRFGRLLGWALLSGRFHREDFFSRREQGPRHVADAIESSLLRERGQAPDRDELEALMVLVWCAAIGYSFGRSSLWQFYGREHTPERDRRFRDLVARLVTRELDLE